MCDAYIMCSARNMKTLVKEYTLPVIEHSPYGELYPLHRDAYALRWCINSCEQNRPWLYYQICVVFHHSNALTWEWKTLVMLCLSTVPCTSCLSGLLSAFNYSIKTRQPMMCCKTLYDVTYQATYQSVSIVTWLSL